MNFISYRLRFIIRNISFHTTVILRANDTSWVRLFAPHQMVSKDHITRALSLLSSWVVISPSGRASSVHPQHSLAPLQYSLSFRNQQPHFTHNSTTLTLYNFSIICTTSFFFFFFLVKYCCSVAKLCPTFWPHGLQHARYPILHYLLEFVQVHGHWVSDAI